MGVLVNPADLYYLLDKRAKFMSGDNPFDKYADPETWAERKIVITDREIALAMEHVRELRKDAIEKWPGNGAYSMKMRSEIEEKADIIEKMCGMVCKC